MGILRKIKYILAILVLASCNDTQRKYYPTGEIEYEVNVIDGKREGKMVEYSVDGKITAISYWKNGKIDGESNIYFENGLLSQKNNFKMGRRCCTSEFFSDEGYLIEHQFIDSLGRVMDYNKYKPDGSQNLDKQSRKAIILSNRDTLNAGETFVATVRLGNRRFSKIDFIVSDLVGKEVLKEPKLPMLDSITALLRIEINPGTNFINGLILETNDHYPDSILAIPFQKIVFGRAKHI
jgi:hypothetical protein